MLSLASEDSHAGGRTGTLKEGQPLVSVVIPTKDRPRLLARAIRSLLSQSFTDYEAWVIDGSAARGAESVVWGFADPRLHYVRSPPRGASAARNLGIELSRGSLIAFLDDDDEWLPEKLKRQVEPLLRSGASVGGTFASYRYVNLAKGHSKVVPICKHESLVERNSVGVASATVIRREVFNNVGCFDEDMPGAEDWDLWLRIADKYRFEYVPAVLVNYYATPGSLSLDRPQLVRAMQMMLRKHPSLEKRKGFMAHYYSGVGQALCQRGLMARGRQYLLQSFRAKHGLYPLALILMGALGGRVYNRLFPMISDTQLSLRLERLIERTG